MKPKWVKTARRFLSRIFIRLLAFNILLVFLPTTGMLLLGEYEIHLRTSQEQVMAQAARVLAASLEATGRLDAADATRILNHLHQRHAARLRVVDRAGRLLADSASLGPRRAEAGATAATDEPDSEPDDSPEESMLYRIGSAPFRFLRGPSEPLAMPAGDDYDTAEVLLGPEIKAALEGNYGATSRLTAGDRSLTLYCTVPVRIRGRTVGAVLVSQSTAKILSTLYAVRLSIFKGFLVSLGVALVLTLIGALTIAYPLARLRRQAEAILDRQGRLRGTFQPSRRSDEIGDLGRALAELTHRLEDHLSFMESFVADVAHELKNPLAGIRTASEMALEVEDPAESHRFLSMIQHDVARIQRLLTGAREISRIDARLDEEERERVDLEALISTIVEGFRMQLGEEGPRIALVVADNSEVWASADRLTQVFSNILDNGVSFSPPGGRVTVSIRTLDDKALVAVSDEGPGIPEEHRDRVFSRFFSYRPASSSGDHNGLGLAIVKAIVTGYAGSVAVDNQASGGAVVTITLPRLLAV